MDSTLQNKASGSQYTVPNKFQLLAPSSFNARNRRFQIVKPTVSRNKTDGICIWNQVTHSKSNDLYKIVMAEKNIVQETFPVLGMSCALMLRTGRKDAEPSVRCQESGRKLRFGNGNRGI